MDKKYLIPAYAEHLKFLLERCSWTVTKIHQHFTFCQEMCKKDFVINNHIARQNAKTPMEKTFYKLMNNSNFGYDCHNNFDNCYFTSVVDEIEEMAYIRKHQSIHDPSIAEFFSSDHLRIQINEDFDNKIAKLNENDNFYEVKKLIGNSKKKRTRCL